MAHAGGRPPKPISQKQFESLCIIQCTREEICAVLDVSEKTIDKWCHETYGESFSLVFEQKRLGGKASLRRNQWRLSETNPTMAIFLGKQFLGQTDKVENNTRVEFETDGFIEALKAQTKGLFEGEDGTIET